jgi:acyl-coenzyme A synthetase/AMP-(fatty) acid ligase
VYCGYWLDNWTFVHSLRSFIERSYNGNFEGVPSYPDYSRFGKLLLNKVTQFYTAPTAIRALAKESLDYVQKYQLDTLKVWL